MISCRTRRQKTCATSKEMTMPVNEKQKYLLTKIPSLYELKRRRKDQPEPRDVRAARRTIEKWEASQKAITDQEVKRLDRLILDAKDAVYFSTPEKALALIKQLEKMLDR